MNKLNDTDFGTPARESETQITLEIDGMSVTVPAGTSVMRASTIAGAVLARQWRSIAA